MADTEAQFQGTMLEPGHDGYDEARRVFNGLVDRKPDRIMQCTSSADVQAAVLLARAAGLPISVYGGGHGVTGAAIADRGAVIDLRGLRGIAVDPEARTARVGGGATWAEVDAATQEHGLAVTGGRMSTTGVGGFTLASGSGWLERYLGYASDCLVEAEVVTASGDLVRASEDKHPDLFWGLHGGGGNFGVVTEFTFRLGQVGPVVLGGMLIYPGSMGREVLGFYRDFMATAPDEVGGGVAYITAPPADFVPEPARGHPAVGVILTYAGPVDEGQRVLAPMIEFGPPAVNLVQPMPYVAVQQLLDEANPAGLHQYWSFTFLDGLPDEAIDAWVTHVQPPSSPLSQYVVVPGGGAITRFPEQSSALARRSAPWSVHMLTMWPPDPSLDATNIAFTQEIKAAMAPWATTGAHVNFVSDTGAGGLQEAYGAERFARLREVKQAWDPENVFQHNQNIPPG
jgi:FAD/FMN-containing dehydrogenase